MTEKTYTTKEAAKKIGVSFRTLNRWLALELIRPSLGVPYGGGRFLWVFSDDDVAKGRKVKAETHPGRKPKSTISPKTKGGPRK
jgi:hypothetical protein